MFVNVHETFPPPAPLSFIFGFFMLLHLTVSNWKSNVKLSQINGKALTDFSAFWFSLPKKGNNFFNEIVFKFKRKENLKRDKEKQRSNAIFQLAAHVLDVSPAHEIAMDTVIPGKNITAQK